MQIWRKKRRNKTEKIEHVKIDKMGNSLHTAERKKNKKAAYVREKGQFWNRSNGQHKFEIGCQQKSEKRKKAAGKRE